MNSETRVPGGRASRSNSQNGMTPSLMRSIQRSLVFRSVNANSAASGPVSRSAAPIVAEIRHRGVIAREQQVIAVVDHHAELRIVIGAAAPARLPGRLMHDDALAPLGEANRGGEAGKSGTDDVDGARHQTNA